MAVKQDYQQWFDTYWAPVDEEVRKVTDGLGELWVMFQNEDYNGQVFAAAIADMPDGVIVKFMAQTRFLIVEAIKKLRLIHTAEQRSVVADTVNAIVDRAIQKTDELLGQLAEDQLHYRIDDLRSKFDEFFEPLGRIYDRAQAQGQAMRDLPRYALSNQSLERLWEANNKLRDSVQRADRAVGEIISIPAQDLEFSVPVPSGVVARGPRQAQPFAAVVPDKIDRTVVDSWNEVALKKLGLGGKTRFYEIGDVVIIDAVRDNQPYVAWAKQQPGINAAARIELTEKGGAFGPGKLKASGWTNQPAVEAAIKKVSKKKVQFS